MMRPPFLVTFGLAAALMATNLPAAPAARTPPSAVSFYGDSGVPDISGIWLGMTMGIPGVGPQSNSGATADGRPPTYFTPWPLPYTTQYQKIYDDRVKSAKGGRALGDIGSRCLPFGLPHMLTSKFYPDEVVQTPGHVVIFVFGTFPIVIWTDGRGHPADLKPSYNGHSIGEWRGDTLVVDTVGIVETTPMDTARNPHSGDMHIKWTMRRVAPDVVHVSLTFYDDKAFTEPVAMTQIWHRKSGPEWAVLDDQSCFENNQDVAPPPTADGFIKF